MSLKAEALGAFLSRRTCSDWPPRKGDSLTGSEKNVKFVIDRFSVQTTCEFLNFNFKSGVQLVRSWRG